MPGVHIIFNVAIIGISLASGIMLSKSKNGQAIAVLSGLLIACLCFFLEFNPQIFVFFLPFSWALFYANFYPFASALVIPSLIRFGKGLFQKVRIGILSAALLGASLYNYNYLFRAPAESSGTIFNDQGVCLQSERDTCSAASIVNLLKLYNINITEQQAIDLAYTKKNTGTRHLGVYRALKILTKDRKDLKVSVKRLSADEVAKINKPAILTVGIPSRLPSQEQIEFARKFNWTPGILHDVVFKEMSDDKESRPVIIEPDYGVEKWNMEHLNFLFLKIAVFIE